MPTARTARPTAGVKKKDICSFLVVRWPSNGPVYVAKTAEKFLCKDIDSSRLVTVWSRLSSKGYYDEFLCETYDEDLAPPIIFEPGKYKVMVVHERIEPKAEPDAE